MCERRVFFTLERDTNNNSRVTKSIIYLKGSNDTSDGTDNVYDEFYYMCLKNSNVSIVWLFDQHKEEDE